MMDDLRMIMSAYKNSMPILHQPRVVVFSRSSCGLRLVRKSVRFRWITSILAAFLVDMMFQA